jgi:alpha-D-xyloside xylohydrolase
MQTETKTKKIRLGWMPILIGTAIALAAMVALGFLLRQSLTNRQAEIPAEAVATPEPTVYTLETYAEAHGYSLSDYPEPLVELYNKNPEARQFVWDVCRRNYHDAHGVKVFWLDEAEPEYPEYEFDHYRYFDGPALQVSNEYPACYARGFYEGLKAAGEADVISLVRCAWAGSQRYGALTWSGDVSSTWQAFREQLQAGLSMGMAGIPWWTTDIGGFHDGWPEKPEFRELFIRWFQWGCYCPVMRLHGDRKPVERVYRGDGTEVLPSGSDNEIWSYGEEAYPILVRYMKRREELRDYVRELMREAHEQGLPLMRAMFYAFPDDPACAELKDQYMFGDRYLVAPVLQPGARSREVYLPAGSWRDADTGEVLSGGRTVTVDAPLERIPVFERA